MKKVGRLVPSLGYQSAYFENYHAFGTNYADWYPSLVDSGTSQSTQVHQTRVPICLSLESRQICTRFGKFTKTHMGILFFYFYFFFRIDFGKLKF